MEFWSTLPRPIVGLAPMDGVTDAAFRSTVAAQAPPDVSFTEFTNVHDVCRGPDHLLASLLYGEAERPIVAQLYGKDPAFFYLAAHVVCALGFDGLDINMGCPSRNVASSGSGAGLIRTPELAHAILRAARRGIEDWVAGQSLEEAGLHPARARAVDALNLARSGTVTVPRRRIPLSVKTRLGFDSVVIEPWIAHLLEERPAAISIHGRTLAQMYRGAADWRAIARAVRVAEGNGTAVLGNGDIAHHQDAAQRVRDTGVDGVLVGRGTLGRPWFFHDKEAVRRSVRDPGAPVPSAAAAPPLEQRFRVMLDHARCFERLFGAARFPRMRKHLGWYCKGFPLAAAMRNRMVRASSSEEVRRIVDEYAAGALSPGADLLAPACCL